MRLLYLSADAGVPVHGYKGASVHLRAMASALNDLGHEVLIASPRVEPGPNPLPRGVRTVEIPAGESAAPAAIELASQEGIEALLERFSLMSVAGARAAAALGIPLAVEVNAPLREEARRFRKAPDDGAARAAEEETFMAAGRIFAVSPALARWLSRPDRVEVMPNAPPVRQFAAKAPVNGAQRELVVGFAGGLKPWQDIPTLLRAATMARAEGARIRLEIVGSGPQEGLLAGADPPVIRRGQLPHDHALEVISGWDVGVAPFIDLEGFYFSPLKLFEYMAAGLCPVVSDVGELAQIVAHGDAGVVVAPRDPAALAGALLELDRDRRHVRELGARAQSAVRERPSWRDNARRVAEALSDG